MNRGEFCITMKNPSTCVSICNKLLRGEISAIDRYQQSLDEIEDLHSKESLQLILEDHQKSVDAIRDHVIDMDGVPDIQSGGWTHFPSPAVETVTYLGQSPAIAALIRCEEHGLSEYEGALDDPEIMHEIKVVFRDTLIPRIQKHIAVLEGLKA